MSAGVDPRAAGSLVADGYDRIADGYVALGRRTGWGSAPEYLEVLLAALRPGSRVLDLGCGAGLPVTAALAREHRVVALDVSPVQLGLARANAPGAALLRADIADVAFVPGSFDAVVCFYSLTHVPRDLHGDVFRRTAQWLRPGGLALFTTGAGDHPDTVTEDFLELGAPMLVGHFDADRNVRLVRDAGLHVLRSDVREQVEDDRTVEFCWILAERTA